MQLYAGRKASNGLGMACSLAAVIGRGWLALILATLLIHGVGGLSLAVFTKMTLPGEAGGLLNPITAA